MAPITHDTIQPTQTATHYSEVPADELGYALALDSVPLPTKMGALFELRDRAVQNGQDPAVLDDLLEKFFDPNYEMGDEEFFNLTSMLDVDPYALFEFNQQIFSSDGQGEDDWWLEDII